MKNFLKVTVVAPLLLGSLAGLIRGIRILLTDDITNYELSVSVWTVIAIIFSFLVLLMCVEIMLDGGGHRSLRFVINLLRKL